jgi:hypothetical protein
MTSCGIGLPLASRRPQTDGAARRRGTTGRHRAASGVLVCRPQDPTSANLLGEFALLLGANDVNEAEIEHDECPL